MRLSGCQWRANASFRQYRKHKVPAWGHRIHVLNSFFKRWVMERVSHFDMDGVHPRLETVSIWKRGVKFLPRNFQTYKSFIINYLQNGDSFVFYARCSTRLFLSLENDFFLTPSITRSYQRLSEAGILQRNPVQGHIWQQKPLRGSLFLRPMRSRLQEAFRLIKIFIINILQIFFSIFDLFIVRIVMRTE